MGKNTIYTGIDNLKIMKQARHYNNTLTKFVCRTIQKYQTTPLQDKIIIDFGSGDAYFARAVQKKLNINILCVEPADNLACFYQDLNVIKNLNSLSSQTVDMIYSLNVLEHIEDDKAVINDFHRVLKPNGIVYLYLPAFPCLFSSADTRVGHYRRYTANSVKQLFPTEQWDIRSVRYSDFCGFFITLLFKFIGNKNGTISPKSLSVYDNMIYPVSLIFDKLTAGKLFGKNIMIEVRKKR